MRVLGGVMLFALAIVGAAASEFEFYTEFVVRGHTGTLAELKTAVTAWLAEISAGSLVQTITVLAKPAV